MAFGLGVLGLAARDFWRMTPRELSAAAKAFGAGHVSAPSRRSLAAMMAKFPDGGRQDG